MASPNTRLLALAIGATAISALFGMYLVLEPVVLRAGQGPTWSSVVASVINLGALVVAGYVVNKTSQAPPSGGAFLPRARRLLRIWAVVTAALLVFILIF